MPPTMLTALVATLHGESLAIAGALRDLTLQTPDAATPGAMPNLLALPLVARVVFAAECLGRLRRAMAETGPDAGRRVAAAHAALLGEPLPPLQEFTDEPWCSLALRLAQVERRYSWLCHNLAEAVEADSSLVPRRALAGGR